MIQPTVFGNLCLLERINIGGMAEIYRAKPFNAPAFDRFLAVKRMLPNLIEDSEFVSMFLDEAKIAIKLNHPNICQNYELGKLGRTPYIVMEYIAGQSLLAIHKRLRTEKKIIHFTPAAFIAREVATALGYAHRTCDEAGSSLGLVHRDVSPQNILISYAGEAKLIDFGIAKIRSSSHTTQVGVLKGKFGYMSPEQVDGFHIDGRSDLFALGTVFYEMLTGKRLFLGRSDFDTLEQVRRTQVKPPSVFNNQLPSELDRIALRALARDRDERYATGEEMAADLTAFLDQGEHPFTPTHLSDWMLHYFAHELDAERKSRELFKQFVSPDDVHRYNAGLLDDIRRSMGAPELDVGEPLLEDEEITQVVDTDVEGYEGRLPAGSRTEDQVVEVIAENLYEPLPNLIARHRQSVLANVDLPDPHEPEPVAELFEPYRSHSRWWLLVLPACLLLGIAAALVAYHLADPPSVRNLPAPGLASIEVLPSDGLQVFVSGQLVGQSTPLLVDGLPPGRVAIEVRHPDHQDYRSELLIESGRVTETTIELLPLPAGEGVLHLTIDPSDARVWLDGQWIEGDGGERHLSLSSGDRHLLEVEKTGYFVWEHWITMRPGTEESLSVALSPVNASLYIQTQPNGHAYLDGVAVGDTGAGARIQALRPLRPHRLRIEPENPGYRSYETTVLFETVLEMSLIVTLRRLGDNEVEPEPAIGYLAIESLSSWARIFLDGVDTGMVAPIPRGEPMALRAGQRQIDLVRGERRAALTVSIQAGDLTVVDCGQDLWDCGQR